MRFIALSFVVLMAGCATQEEIQARQQAYVNALKSRCEAYGFKEGDPSFANCMMQLDAQVRNAQAANNAALMGYSQSLMQMGQPRTLGGQGFTCMPNGIGGVACQ